MSDSDIRQKVAVVDSPEAEVEVLHAILDSIGDGVVVADPGGEITLANPAAEEILGRELLSLTIEDWGAEQRFVDADDEEPLATERLPLARALQGETVDQAEIVLRREDGRRAWLNVTARPIFDVEDRFRGGVLVFRDVTETRRAERELNRTARDLERSNRDLEQFAYVASHDLQEPLRMVTSYTQLLERRYGDRLDDDADDFIHYIVDGAERMKDLINDLLAYSRAGSRDEPFEPVQGPRLLQEVLDSLQDQIDRAGAEIDHDPMPTIVGDRVQLRRVFQNLISNSIGFASEGSVPRIEVRVERRVDEHHFSVTDNGPGLAADDPEAIFLPFQRGYSADGVGGSGMGLAICKRIVERHGGRIWAESGDEGGATFRFTIPVRAAGGEGDETQFQSDAEEGSGP